MSDDTEFLRRFVASGSESDFAELVRRNASLVYHAALRRTGGRADLAEDVSQQVFVVLARNAPILLRHTSLTAWLYTTTRQTSYRLLRDDTRRRARERKFAAMTELTKPEAQVAWEKLRPQLDRLLDELSDADREALLLRYVQGHSVTEVGSVIGLAPDSARKRIERAVDRLRGKLAKQGLTTSAVVVAELLGNEAAGAVPPQLLQRLAGAAVKQLVPNASVSSAAAFAGSAALSSATLVGIAIVVLGGAAAVGISFRTARAARAEVAQLEQKVQVSQARLQRLRAAPASGSLAGTAAAPATAANAAAAGPAKSTAPVSSTLPREIADARANGARFLATAPDARVRLTSFEKTQMHATFAGFYRAAHMSPPDIDAFEQRVADYHLSAVELSENRMVTTAGNLPVDQVSALLGPERAEIYANYLPKMAARHLALEAAATVNYVADVASPAQVDQITTVLADANAAYKSGGNVDLAAEDWNAAMPRLKALLTPGQWAAVEGLFLGHAYQQALRVAQVAAQGSGPADTAAVVGAKEGSP